VKGYSKKMDAFAGGTAEGDMRNTQAIEADSRRRPSTNSSQLYTN